MATVATANKKKVGRGKAAPRSSRAQLSAHVPEALITYRVSVLSQLLSRLVDASVREGLGLSSRQWRVLVMLNKLGTSTSGDVARVANFDHSQVSRVAFELAQLGLVTQVSDAADRRKQLLELTPAGIECLRSGLPGSLQREARLRSRLSAEEYASFCHSLEVLGDEAIKLIGETKGDDGPGGERSASSST